MKSLMIKTLLRFLPCAFDSANMNRLAAGTATLWMYKTTDALATVVGSGYFSDYAEWLKNGDVIIVVDTNVPTVDVCAVTSAGGGATPVTVQNGT